MHAARMQVVVLHQRLDGGPDGGANLAGMRLRVRIQGRRDRLLDLERQLIEAALRGELHERTDPQLEVACTDEDLRLAPR